MDIISKLLPCWHLNGVYILFMELNQKLQLLLLLLLFFFVFYFHSEEGGKGVGGEERPSMCNSFPWKLEMAAEAAQYSIYFIYKRNSKPEKMK